MADGNNKKQRLSENTGFSWFAFDCIDWLTSMDVQRMTAAERGVYITLLAIQWVDTHLPNDVHLLAKRTGFDRRLLDRWFANHGDLFPKSPANPMCLANRKLWNLAITVGKIASADYIQDKTLNETRQEERTTVPPSASSRRSSPSLTSTLPDPDRERPCSTLSEPEATPPLPEVPAQEPEQPAPADRVKTEPPSSPDPRHWNRDVAGITAERIRHCVAYQLDSKKNKWYLSNLTTAALGRDAFIAKLDADTPQGWTPDKAKPTTETILPPDLTFWVDQLKEKSHEC
jgi:hypothetical protein